MTVGLARKLSRTKSHRDALLRNLVSQLFQHESIITTYEKCKETSRLAERIITSAKKYDHGNGSNRYIRNIQSKLSLSGDNKHLLAKVVNELADRYKDRNGGFTRILKLEPRVGDKSKQATIELVDTPIITKNNGKNITMQRGNIKFWLLMKTLLYNEINNEVYSPLTIKNLLKIYKTKANDPKKLNHFKEEMICVRKLLMEQMNKSDLKNDSKNRSFEFNQIKESNHIDSVLSQLSEMLSSSKDSINIHSKSKYNNINRKCKGGYQIMSSRPERKEQQPYLK